MESPHPPSANLPDGALLFTQFMIKDVFCNAMSSTLKHDYDFTPANSMVIECGSQEEIDYFWERLSANGGSTGRCGWLSDPFGISWQIIPEELMEMMSDPTKASRVGPTLQMMDKLNRRMLLEAAEQLR